MVGAFATMGLVAVGITLPNSPGLVGQFQWFTLLGLSLYLGPGAADKQHTRCTRSTFAFANVHYVLQVSWYVAVRRARARDAVGVVPRPAARRAKNWRRATST